MTLNQQINLIKQFATNHRQINTVRHEPVYNVNGLKEKNGFVLWFYTESSNLQGQSLRTTFVITCMDVLDNGKTNLDDVLSDSLLILLDLEAYLIYYEDEADAAGNKYNYTIERNGNFEPGIDRFDDDFAGHTVRFTFIQGYSNDYCAIPLKPASTSSNWILATGFWDDDGVWDDDAVWID